MRQSLGDYPLLDRQTGQAATATLYKPIATNNLDDFEQLWRPAMDTAASTLAADSASGTVHIQDAHWEWRAKHNDRSDRLDYDSFAVECDGETQGLMFVRTVGFAKEPSQTNKPLIYVDLISVAPWNRPSLNSTPRFKGIGTLLFAAALSLSINEGFDGRVGLHSLSQSEGWYRSVCKMTDFGPDPNYPGKLVYFEFTPAQAQAYLNQQQ